MAVCMGIDEAGFGPLLGPLVVTATRVEAADEAEATAELLAADLGIGDSKVIHTSGDLAPLERVALPALTWLCGLQPSTAAECFALLGEGPEQRDLPWMQGAEALRLPCATADLPEWQLPRPRAVGLSGAILHPLQLNDARERGINRSASQLEVVVRLLGEAVGTAASEVVVDRLGGRRYYSDALALASPGAVLEILEELPENSSYSLQNSAGVHRVSFRVGGDSSSALVAIAGCISKYIRELHMRLFNAHWCERHPWLKPTAGYYQDAKRWLYQIGSGSETAWARELVRLSASP